MLGFGDLKRNSFTRVLRSGAVPLEGDPLPVQRLVRAPAQRRRLRGADLPCYSLFLVQCSVSYRFVLKRIEDFAMIWCCFRDGVWFSGFVSFGVVSMMEVSASEFECG